MVTAAIERPELLDHLECDKCGARAMVHAVAPGGRDLVFCGHHGRLYADGLRAEGFEINELN